MVNFDINGVEIEKITDLIDINGKRILEIGCGDGRLTNQLAPKSEYILAIDSDHDLIAQNKAKNSFPHVDYSASTLVELEIDLKFDIILYSLSLCCVEPENNVKEFIVSSLTFLKQGGKLVSIMPNATRLFNSDHFLYDYAESGCISQVIDMDVTNAILALKQLSFREKALDFVIEDTFSTTWSYDNRDQWRDKWIERYDAIQEPIINEKEFLTHVDQFLDDRNGNYLFPVVENILIFVKL